MAGLISESLYTAAPFTGPAAPFVAIAGGIVDFFGIGEGRNQANIVTGAMAEYDPLLKSIIYGDPLKMAVGNLEAQLNHAEQDLRQRFSVLTHEGVIPTADWYLNKKVQNDVYGIINFQFARDYIRRARDMQGIPTYARPPQPTSGLTTDYSAFPEYSGIANDDQFATPPYAGPAQQSRTSWSIVEDVLDTVAPSIRGSRDLPVQSTLAVRSASGPDYSPLLIAGAVIGGWILLSKRRP